MSIEIPPFDSERIKFHKIYDRSRRRHLIHEKILLVDNVIVDCVNWSEDEDWDSLNESEPTDYELYNQWCNKVISRNNS